MDSELTNHRQRVKPAKTGGGRAFHSRLEPLVDFIRAQRQKRKTWKEIAELLRTEKGCPITFQGIHQFYRRYVKRAARSHWEIAALQPAANPSAVPEPERKPILAATPPQREFRRPNAADIQLNDLTNVWTSLDAST